MARDGVSAHPAVPPPPGLRRYLGFTKVAGPTLGAIARVVDGDDEFRSRVADAVDEEQVGRAGWLWLTRPDGWADEVAALDRDRREQRAAAREERQERAAAKRLAATQAALERAEAVVAGGRAELAAARAELAAEHDRHLEALERVQRLEGQVEMLTAARADAVRHLKQVESKLVRRSTEINALRARVRDHEAGRGSPPPVATPAVGDEGPVGGPTLAPAGGPPLPDVAALATELDRAARGATELAEGLSRLAGLLADRPDRGASPGGDEPPAPPVATSPGRDPANGEVVRREALALPGGMFDDSTEAARHLLHTTGVVLLVDGYNVSMAGWPELGPADQRQRLVAMLGELAARTATPVEVVFDGSETSGATVPAAVRQLVHVRFSPADVEADDVVIDMVSQIPPATPVVVASSDNRVRAGARRGGANVLHASQLLAVSGRAPG